MISIKRAVTAGVVIAMMASNSFAQVSASYADWGKGPAQFLMTEAEANQWKSIKTDAEAKAFVDLFWAKRDPSPATPFVNEFKTEFEVRVATADKNFTTAKKKGSMTELGRYLVILGPPTRIERRKAAPNTTVQRAGDSTFGRGSVQDYSPSQLWYYEKGKAQFDTGSPILELGFMDQYNTGEWTAERTGKTDMRQLLHTVVAQGIKSPNLTQAPAAPVQQAPLAPTAPAASASGSIKTESLRTAISDYKAAATKPYKQASVYFTELVSPTGEAYIPVQLYIPKTAGLTTEAVTTFFGVIEDASGTAVHTFEEPATLSTSNGDLYFDKAINVAPGKYTATLGLSGADGKPVVMSSAPMEVRDYGKETVGISRLVLAHDMHETEAAAPAGAPYAFGKLKIVPKGDRVFANRDEISYFIEVFNPGVAEQVQEQKVVVTNTTQTGPGSSQSISREETVGTGVMLPNLQVKFELTGKGKDGKPVSITSPLSDVAALPLSGKTGPGNFAIIGSIPLGEMKTPPQPGDYSLKVTVLDRVTKQKYSVDQSFTLVAGAAPAATPAPAK